MRVFIFGAGASKGAQQGTVHEHRIAPLTNELFDPRYKVYADMVGLNDTLMNVCRENISKFISFEEWLTSEWNKISSFKEVATRDAQKGFMAQIAFYIWLTLLGVSKWTYENHRNSRDNNTYLILMSKLFIKDEPFGLINFNYDLLLDFAYKDAFRKTFQNLDDYLNNNYVKPHGSVNWLLSKRHDDRNIDISHENNMDTRTRLDTAISLMFRDAPVPMSGILIKDPNHRDLYTIDDLLRSFNRQYFYPLIFLPLTSKAYSSISGFEDKIIAKGKDLISRAKEIYLIGYQANDDIIREMVKSATKGTKLHVVGLDSSDMIVDGVLKWASNLEKGQIYKEGFYKFAYDISF